MFSGLRGRNALNDESAPESEAVKPKSLMGVRGGSGRVYLNGTALTLSNTGKVMGEIEHDDSG